jgi:chromosomal replication initiator protein
MLVSAENWATDYYHAMQMKSTRIFRRKYRNCNMLLLDDVQYVQGRPGSQVELVHTVKHILDRGGRVVLAGRPGPTAFTDVNDAFVALIRKAFSGMLVRPSEQERVDILEELVRRNDVDVTPEVLHFLARSHGECFASMKSAVAGLGLCACMEPGKVVTMPMAVSALSAMQPAESTRRVTLKDIRATVVDVLGVTADQLEGRSRTRTVCRARHVAMYLSNKLTEASLSDIARFYGRGSHSTVKHAVEKISDQSDADRHLASVLDRMEKELTGSN